MDEEFYASSSIRTEKNASGWSKEKLRSLLVGMVIEDPHIGEWLIYDFLLCPEKMLTFTDFSISGMRLFLV